MSKKKFYLSASERQIYKEFAALTLPRHTSYPAVPFWDNQFNTSEIDVCLSQIEGKQKFALYIHVPYCKSLCYYCGCTKEIYGSGRLSKKDPREDYIQALEKEIVRYAQKLKNSSLEQIHFGGGSPTFLEPSQLKRIFEILQHHFQIGSEVEMAIEIDPRIVSDAHLNLLASVGFNRISLGIQDFDAKVQQAVNRVQSFSLVENLVAKCKSFGFPINFDLIYGLPHQTLDSIEETIRKVLLLSPDRIAFYRLAMIPDMFKWQKAFTRESLPEENQMLEINLFAINTFVEAGYSFIGLDHFAKPDDSLTQSLLRKTMRRNFQGMTTGEGLDIVAIGPSAISQFEGCYVQNVKTDRDWKLKVQEGFPIHRGLVLNRDDLIRQSVIESLYCYGEIEIDKISERWEIDFDQYFYSELKNIDLLSKKGIVDYEDNCIRLTSVLGRLLVRLVASLFDQYVKNLDGGAKAPLFSQL